MHQHLQDPYLLISKMLPFGPGPLSDETNESVVHCQVQSDAPSKSDITFRFLKNTTEKTMKSI